ncbi:MAG: TIGR01777 family oxidoreductase [Bacteroidota bacterium]
MAKQVLIAGGTGLVGQQLSLLLEEKGYQVAHLSRTRNLDARFPAYAWDLKKETIDLEAIQKADYIINLAGAGIADKRWSAARKQVIISSRVKSAALLKKYIQAHRPNLNAYLSATAIGYYGERGDENLTEKSSAGTTGFLPESVKAWEKGIESVASTGIRTVGIRIGIVLSTEGGALAKMLLPAKLGANTYFGDGQQWYAWIHIQDVCRLFVHAMERQDIYGFYNGTAPHPERNKAFAKVLGEVLNRPWVLPAPAFALRLAMGEMADVVLTSAKVLPQRTLATGFTFKFEHLKVALEDLINK